MSGRLFALFVFLYLRINETQSSTDGRQRPNVVLIVADDLRTTLGCYGEPVLKTHNIDNLASKSVLFDQAFVQQAVCGPSRISFLTSRRPDTTRFYDFHTFWRLNAGNYTTLPQHFKENGYITQSVGKVFHPGIASNHTDDAYYSWTNPPYHPPTQVYKNAKICPNKDKTLGKNVVCPVDVPLMPGETLPDMESANYAVDFLKNMSATESDKPFFLAVGFHNPHLPLKFPKKYLSLYPRSDIKLTEHNTFPWKMPLVAWNPWIDLRNRDDVKVMNLKFPFEQIPDYYQIRIKQSYYAATSYLDTQVGKVLEALETGGFSENTIVVFVSDHGWSLGEHGVWTKYSLFEVAVRVPLIIYIPRVTYTKTYEREKIFQHFDFFSKDHNPKQEEARINKEDAFDENEYRIITSNSGIKTLAFKPGFKSSSLVEVVDLFPTIAEAAGLPTVHVCPEDTFRTILCTEGVSLMPLIENVVKNMTGATVNNSYIRDTFRNNNSKGSLNNENDDLQYSLEAVHHKAHRCSDEYTPAKSDGIPWRSAVFSQYPRPSVEPQHNTELPRLNEIRIMGYSMWTPDFHYTEWVKFNPNNFTVVWEDLYGRELYLRSSDPHEINNVAMLDRCFQLVEALSTKLQTGWRGALPK